MQRAQVADDSVKFAVAPICRAAAAITIFILSRKHDFEKERRRRKQDFLLRVAEELDRLTLCLESAASLRGVVSEARDSGQQEMERGAIDALSKQIEEAERYESKFGMLETPLYLFEFSQCSERFRAVTHATAKLKAALTTLTGGPEEQEAALRVWWEAEAKFREELVAVFKAL
jgi:hypothetical protein